MTLLLCSHVKLTKLVLPGMIARKQGHIVNTVSLAGKLFSPVRSAYCAAKSAMMFFFDSLRIEVAEHGISVTNVCPGSVATDVARNALTGNGGKFGGSDPNIDNGMQVDRCAHLFLVAVSNGLYEAWMWGSAAERLAIYFAVYAPFVFKNLTVRYADRLCSRYRAVIDNAAKER